MLHANRKPPSRPTSAKSPSEIGLGGEILREINGLGREPSFLGGHKVEVAIVNGRWVLTAVPAKPPVPKPVLHYFPDD